MPRRKAKTAHERQQQRRVHYKMPRIEGKPPVMREPPRFSATTLRPGERDWAKNLHVADYYEWVADTWNADHPDNPLPVFTDGCDVERRNDMHKRQIGDVLASKLKGVYRSKTFRQARIQDYQSLGDAMEEVYRISDISYFAKHSHNKWMVKKLTEQHMEAVSRSARRTQPKLNEKENIAVQPVIVSSEQRREGNTMQDARLQHSSSRACVDGGTSTIPHECSNMKTADRAGVETGGEILSEHVLGPAAASSSTPKSLRTEQANTRSLPPDDIHGQMRKGQDSLLCIPFAEIDAEQRSCATREVSDLLSNRNVAEKEPGNILTTRFSASSSEDRVPPEVVLESKRKRREHNESDDDPVPSVSFGIHKEGEVRNRNVSQTLYTRPRPMAPPRERRSKVSSPSPFLTLDKVRQNRVTILQKSRKHDARTRTGVNRLINDCSGDNSVVLHVPREDRHSVGLGIDIEEEKEQGDKQNKGEVEIDAIDEQIRKLLDKRRRLERSG